MYPYIYIFLEYSLRFFKKYNELSFTYFRETYLHKYVTEQHVKDPDLITVYTVLVFFLPRFVVKDILKQQYKGCSVKYPPLSISIINIGRY